MSCSRIIVENSTSLVENMTMEQYRALKKVLVYVPSGQPGHRVFPQPLIDKKGHFPTGLLRLANQVLKDVEIVDRRRPPKLNTAQNKLQATLTPYPEQNEIVEAAIAYKRGIISAVTAFGKSITMALLVARLQVRTLIIVPNLGLKHQLTETFRKLFKNLNNITIENIDSASLIKHTNYDLLIIDEAHHAAAKTYRDLSKKAWNGIYWRFFFTGTPFRTQANEQILLESITGKVIYEIGYKKAVSKGHITPVEAYFIEIPRSKVVGKTWQQVYSELVVRNEQKNLIIARLIQALSTQKVSTLCLVKEIAHGKALSALTGVPFANGESEDTADLIEHFNRTDVPALIGTTGVLGEGTDTRPAEFIIIAGLGKSKPAFMQQVGRGLRKYPGKESAKIILIKDMSHRFARNHFNEQVKILKDEYGVIPARLELTF